MTTDTLTPPDRCGACGAKVEFAPGRSSLRCPYCGQENAVTPLRAEQSKAVLEALDYEAWLTRDAGNEPPLPSQTATCAGCGAQSALPQDLTADRCPFCAAPLVAPEAYAGRLLRPGAVVPFALSESRVRDEFRSWIKGLWFAPETLRKACRAATGIKGRYLPYWTYDSDTFTPYQGERGDHYDETESYEEEGVRKERQVQRTRWSGAVGAVTVPFADVLVPASGSLPRESLERLKPWRLADLEPDREDYLAGFTVEAYRLGLQPGFERARERMEQEIREAICRDIGGDEQRITQLAPQFRSVRFKHILLPVWVSSYAYGGKTWRYLVNGQTGAVWGERPWSAWKIGLTLAAVLVAIGVAFYLFGTHR